MVADFRMKAVGEIERQGALGKVDDVAFGSVDKNLIGEEIEFKFLEVDFFAFFLSV